MKLSIRFPLILFFTPSPAHPFSSLSSLSSLSLLSSKITTDKKLQVQSVRKMSGVSAAEEDQEHFTNFEAVAKKYGLPGNTDPDGFDPYADTVGPGIYGGNVQKDDGGKIVIGQQYQNHNSRPGPLYAGNGYSLMSRAVHTGNPDKVVEILADYPELVGEVSTGGARPLHVCGMSKRGQLCTQALIDAGADMYALDTYNYNALHRMASNDLHIGAEALVKAGMDPNAKAPESDSTPIEIARRSRAINFLMTMQKLGHYD